MLQSAPGLRSLILTYQNLADPAAEGFAAAATQLTSLSLYGDSAQGVHTCAHADFVLQACKSLQRLSCSGWCVPAWYPQTLEVLSLDLSDCCRAFSRPAYGEAVMMRMARLPHLRRLHLELRNTAWLPREEILLPQLQHLSVCVDMEDRTEIDLSWLQSQLCHLRVDVHVSGDADLQRSLSSQLHELHVEELTLYFQNDFTSELQEIWHQVSVAGTLKVSLGRWITPVQQLPRCRELRFSLSDDYPDTAEVAWQAVAAANSVIVTLHMKYGFHLSEPGSMADVADRDRPWQLCVQGHHMRVHVLAKSCGEVTRTCQPRCHAEQGPQDTSGKMQMQSQLA